jgi:hypothetical protein
MPAYSFTRKEPGASRRFKACELPRREAAGDAFEPARPLVFVASQVALAAIAAAFAFFAQVIIAGVLGAVDANFRRRLLANAALKSGGLTHGFSLAYFAPCDGVVAGAGAASLGAAGAGRAGG